MGLLRRLTAVLSLLALCGMMGCAGFWVPVNNSNSSGNGGTANDYVYVANASTQWMAGYAVGTGSLTAIAGSPFALGFTPTAAVVNSANSILFVSSSAGIYSYAIASNGVLSSLTSGITSGLNNVVSLAVSPDGNWLFALDGTSTANVVTVYEFSINSSTGALSAVNSNSQTYKGTYSIAAPVSTVVASPSQIAVASVSSGEYLFVALGTGGTLIIPFNTSTGVQAPAGTSVAQIRPPTGGPNSNYWADSALAVNASTSVLYIVSSDTSSSNGVIAAYVIGSNGTQATLGTPASGATAFQPAAVAINTAGTDVYVANTAGDSISAFGTTASGSSLPGLTGSPYPFGYAPTGLAVDNSGNYLLAIAQDGGPDLTMYSYGPAGQLSEAASINTGNGTEPAGAVAIAATH